MALAPPLGSGDAASLFRTPEALLALLRAAWGNAVGADLARRTRVVAVNGAVLRVQVPDARWRKVLHRLQGTILGRLERLVGPAAPRRIGFIEAPLPQDPGPPPPAEPAVQAPVAVIPGAEAIEDPELRRLFLETASRYLARSRSR